jgi:uncharacterized membrane protein YvlD (DUF360 family)
MNLLLGPLPNALPFLFLGGLCGAAVSSRRLPINVATLRRFTFVVNALFLLLVSALVKGAELSGFDTALLGAVVLAALH